MKNVYECVSKQEQKIERVEETKRGRDRTRETERKRLEIVFGICKSFTNTMKMKNWRRNVLKNLVSCAIKIFTNKIQKRPRKLK